MTDKPMTDKVVTMKGTAREPAPQPLPTAWHAHVDLRLERIERMISRLEWQVWISVCGLTAIFVLTLLQSFTPV